MIRDLLLSLYLLGLLGSYHMLYLLLENTTLYFMLTTKIVSSGICEPLCESIGSLSR